MSPRAPWARTALHQAGDRALALSAYPAAVGYYRAALALWPQHETGQRADLLRLLGTTRLEAGELGQAEAVLAEGSEAAAAARLPALQARIRLQLAELHNLQGHPFDDALADCEAATAILSAEGDLEGLAEAWLLTGMTRFWLGRSPADQQALERAIAHAGRFADAREAIARARSVHDRCGARVTWARSRFAAGVVELIAETRQRPGTTCGRRMRHFRPWASGDT